MDSSHLRCWIDISCTNQLWCTRWIRDRPDPVSRTSSNMLNMHARTQQRGHRPAQRSAQPEIGYELHKFKFVMLVVKRSIGGRRKFFVEWMKSEMQFVRRLTADCNSAQASCGGASSLLRCTPGCSRLWKTFLIFLNRKIFGRSQTDGKRIWSALVKAYR